VGEPDAERNQQRVPHEQGAQGHAFQVLMAMPTSE